VCADEQQTHDHPAQQQNGNLSFTHSHTSTIDLI
jgi:hypothetical protein